MNEPVPRFNTASITEPESIHREALWNQAQKLMHTSEILESEEIIEPATANMLMQIAIDFKTTLQAVEDLIEKEGDRPC